MGYICLGGEGGIGDWHYIYVDGGPIEGWGKTSGSILY